jgi:hypothetical protein
MKWQCADRAMKTDYSFELVTKADLTLKIEIGNKVLAALLQD